MQSRHDSSRVSRKSLHMRIVQRFIFWWWCLCKGGGGVACFTPHHWQKVVSFSSLVQQKQQHQQRRIHQQRRAGVFGSGATLTTTTALSQRRQSANDLFFRRGCSSPSAPRKTSSSCNQRFASFSKTTRRVLPPTLHNRNSLLSTSLPTLSSSTSTALNMCQLLGMNCATPTDFTFSFTGFAQRGGVTDKHSDGWGLVFYEGRGVRCFHDSLPASKSPVAHLMASYPCKTLNMLSHIRYATEGKVSLENVHPFQREMWGIQWIFAHNGDIAMFKGGKEHPWLGDEPGEKIYHPVGFTDSEAFFCALLNALRAKFDRLPTLPILHEEIKRLVSRVVDHDQDQTILNFLLTCGQHVQFAYSWPGSRPGSKVWNGLYYTIREPPFQMANLKDCDVCVDFAELTCENDRVAVIATSPLTDNEVWIEFKRGELILFDEGIPHVASAELHRVEMMGHGLLSNAMPKEKLPSLEVDQRHLVHMYGMDI